jgi:hypothetical protein
MVICSLSRYGFIHYMRGWLHMLTARLMIGYQGSTCSMVLVSSFSKAQSHPSYGCEFVSFLSFPISPTTRSVSSMDHNSTPLPPWRAFRWQFSASSFSACRLVLHTYNNGSNTLSTHERTESSHAGRGEIWRRPRRHSRLSSTLDLYADVDVFGLSTFSPADLALDGLESPDSAGQPLDRLPSP